MSIYDENRMNHSTESMNKMIQMINSFSPLKLDQFMRQTFSERVQFIPDENTNVDADHCQPADDLDDDLQIVEADQSDQDVQVIEDTQGESLIESTDCKLIESFHLILATGEAGPQVVVPVYELYGTVHSFSELFEIDRTRCKVGDRPWITIPGPRAVSPIEIDSLMKFYSIFHVLSFNAQWVRVNDRLGRSYFASGPKLNAIKQLIGGYLHFNFYEQKHKRPLDVVDAFKDVNQNFSMLDFVCQLSLSMMERLTPEQSTIIVKLTHDLIITKNRVKATLMVIEYFLVSTISATDEEISTMSKDCSSKYRSLIKWFELP